MYYYVLTVQNCVLWNLLYFQSKQPISVTLMSICFISTSIMLPSNLQYEAPTLMFHRTPLVTVKIIFDTITYLLRVKASWWVFHRPLCLYSMFVYALFCAVTHITCLLPLLAIVIILYWVFLYLFFCYSQIWMIVGSFCGYSI